MAEPACSVLLIHGSGSAARAILPLGERIARAVPGASVDAVKLAGGYGGLARDPSLPIIEQHLDVVLQALGDESWHLVGHSMGGFLALQAALAVPEQVQSLALIEPMAFGVLDAVADAEALEIDRRAIRAFQAGLADGSGIGHFIGTWNQAGWSQVPEAVRNRLTGMASQIYEEAAAVSFDETPLAGYANLHPPILLMAGARTLLPAQRIVERLATLEGATRAEPVEGAGHMDVVRFPERFAPAIGAHILG